MGNFGKSRLRKGISIVAAMVLLLNSIMPTVPVFAETKAQLQDAGCTTVDGIEVALLDDEADYNIVAKIGSACYTTIGEAVAAYNDATGETEIVIKKTNASAESITTNKNITINLDGNTINACVTVNGGILTVKDKDDNSGSIECSGFPFTVNAGTLKMYGGTYEDDVDIWVKGDNTKAEIYGGVYKSNDGNTAAVWAYNGGVIDIHGGTFIGLPGAEKDGKCFWAGAQGEGTTNGTVNIYGGSFDGRISASEGSVYHIQGGSFGARNVAKTAECSEFVEQGQPINAQEGCQETNLDAYLVEGYIVSTENNRYVVIAAANCTFNGELVAHGSSVTAYATSSETCGVGECASEVRTCNNGTLDGTYTNAECTYQGVSYSAEEYPLNACPEHGSCTEVTPYTVNNNACVVGDKMYKLNSCGEGYTPDGNECKEVAQTYTLTLDPNGGTLTQTSYSDLAYNTPFDLTQLTISKTGYTLAGWYDGDTPVESPYTVTANKTLTAHWTVNPYTVTFKLDQNTDFGSKSVNFDAPIFATEAEYDEYIPVQNNKIFKGWKLEGNDLPSKMPANSIEVYADWENMPAVNLLDENGDDATTDGANYSIVMKDNVESEAPTNTDENAEAQKQEINGATVAPEANNPKVLGGLEIKIKKENAGNTEEIGGNIHFGTAYPIQIPINGNVTTVKIKVRHRGVGQIFGWLGLATNQVSCTDGVPNSNAYTGTPLTVTCTGVGTNRRCYVTIYTCSASTFVAYTEDSSSSSPSSTSSSGGGGPSYSCKNLPANAVANNNTTPKKNTDYSYSTDTGAVCTFQCKTGYARNEETSKCEKADGTEDILDTENDANTASDTDASIEDLQKVLEDGYTQEFHNAYEFAFKNGITTMSSIEAASMKSPLTRIAMAKMLSNYAINVLGKTPDTSKTVSFPDVSDKLNADYGNGVTLAYQLGIMGINIDNFRPSDLVTRAEFGTALSRLLYGTADGEGAYYETHLKKLMDEKIITNADPKLRELRGYVMIMLMRSANA